jgi:phytoene synthase
MERFRRGSRTFSFAALLFSRRQLLATRDFYTFCRIVDDAIDEAPSPTVARQRAMALLEAIDQGGPKNGELPNETLDETLQEALQSWRDLEANFKLPQVYARELILGQLMDAQGFRPATLTELDLYCFRVAGVVGLTMCHITGILLSRRDTPSSSSAAELEYQRRVLTRAAACGRALQLTNIARDLFEDHQRGRQYFPQNLEPQQSSDFNETIAYRQAQFLLAWAEESYRMAEQGWQDLPLRARLAVAVAQTLYREIGQQLLAEGAHATRTRSVVSRPRQILLAVQVATTILLGELLRGAVRLFAKKVRAENLTPQLTLNFDDLNFSTSTK